VKLQKQLSYMRKGTSTSSQFLFTYQTLRNKVLHTYASASSYISEALV